MFIIDPKWFKLEFFITFHLTNFLISSLGIRIKETAYHKICFVTGEHVGARQGLGIGVISQHHKELSLPSMWT